MKRRSCAVVLASLVTVGMTLTGAVSADEPQRPEITEIEVFPESLTLQNVRDAKSLIVSGETAEGVRYDLTQEATFKPAGPQVSIEDERFVVPEKSGQTEVVISAAGRTKRVPVQVKDVSSEPVNFVREIMPIISKVGCNAGTCHGAQDGQNGFKLSLRGYDPLFDYRALVDDISGRRFNRSRPSQSLMLLKPTQGVPHEGGFLFDEDSRYYALIEQWIAEGCHYETAQRAASVEVFPKKPLLQRAGDTQQLIVRAHYPDGSTRDVTRDAVFDTSNFEAATVSESGRIEAVRRGEAAALVRYEGCFAAAPVTVLGDREGFEWQPSPEFNFVDEHVNNKLKRVKVLPSELCTDAEFLRRVSLDLTGVTPTVEETRAFLNDPRDSREKRQAQIDELIGSPEYVERWTLKWSDLLLANREFITEKGVWAFRQWIRHAIATNKPYDEFVYDLLTASGSTFESPATNYYRIAREPNAVMENMTMVFLGTRFQCNKCHDHPFERWTQEQYYELSAYFSGVGHKQGPSENELVVFTRGNPQPVVHPGTGKKVSPEFPYTHEGQVESEASRRQKLAQWLTSPENPYFAKSLVNRYWSYFTGRGIITPVDDIRSSNPPSNPELLKALTRDFIEHDFDLNHLVRTIVSSHTYQRSFRTNEWNAEDEINYSHAVPRRLTAEQLYDAIMTAAGAPSDLPGVPDGLRATQLPDPNVKVSFLDMFGRPPRESPCECERSSEVSLEQTLNLVNGPTVAKAVSHPKGLIARRVKEGVSDEKLVEDVYLAVFCRRPTKEEAKKGVAYLKEVDDRPEAAQDLMWALINSPAFLFNR